MVYDDISFSNFTLGGNREPDSVYANKGLLRKIYFPTKGSTELIYEPNMYFGRKINYQENLEECYLITQTDEQQFGDTCSVRDTIVQLINESPLRSLLHIIHLLVTLQIRVYTPGQRWKLLIIQITNQLISIQFQYQE